MQVFIEDCQIYRFIEMMYVALAVTALADADL